MMTMMMMIPGGLTGGGGGGYKRNFTIHLPQRLAVKKTAKRTKVSFYG